jgi:hypothetical protein
MRAAYGTVMPLLGQVHARKQCTGPAAHRAPTRGERQQHSTRGRRGRGGAGERLSVPKDDICEASVRGTDKGSHRLNTGWHHHQAAPPLARVKHNHSRHQDTISYFHQQKPHAPSAYMTGVRTCSSSCWSAQQIQPQVQGSSCWMTDGPRRGWLSAPKDDISESSAGVPVRAPIRLLGHISVITKPPPPCPRALGS